MPLTAHDRIAEITGKIGTVRIIRKGRKHSRVVPINPVTGEEIGSRALISNDRLMNVRFFDELLTMQDQAATQLQPAIEPSHTIRVSGATWLALQRLAQPLETPDEVIRRLLPTEGGNGRN